MRVTVIQTHLGRPVVAEPRLRGASEGLKRDNARILMKIHKKSAKVHDTIFTKVFLLPKVWHIKISLLTFKRSLAP